MSLYYTKVENNDEQIPAVIKLEQISEVFVPYYDVTEEEEKYDGVGVYMQNGLRMNIPNITFDEFVDTILPAHGIYMVKGLTTPYSSLLGRDMHEVEIPVAFNPNHIVVLTDGETEGTTEVRCLHHESDYMTTVNTPMEKFKMQIVMRKISHMKI